MISIIPRNKNGFVIPPGIANVSLFEFNVTGIQDSSYIYNNTIYNGTSQGNLQFYYNATRAQKYQVSIEYADQVIALSPYTSTVVANVIDLSTLTATDVTFDDSGSGSFDLSATDRFGNPVVLPDLETTLSPACSFPNVTCLSSNLLYTCDYTVQQAGVYCITVVNTTLDIEYPVIGSTILVTGGAGCSGFDFCSGNGVCYIDTNNVYQCNCKDGYTGDNCNTKISSKYMLLWLGVGLLIGLSILLLIIGVIIGCLLGRRNRGSKNLLN